MTEKHLSIAKISKIKQRQHDNMLDIHFSPGQIDKAWFNHSVLCQTFFPYNDPGTLDIYEHKQGKATLAIQCLKAMNPETKSFEFVGLPWGAKARLISSHINTKAIKTQSKIIDVEESMTGFIKSMGLNPDGYTIKGVKDQLTRLSNSVISLGYSEDGINAKQVNFGIVKSFEFWGTKDKHQKSLWNSTIELTEDYFESLMLHAIPLDERALCALAHNAMALDIYSWLAQRLHRIPHEKPQFVSWVNLKDQFGRNYARMDKFKQVFRATLHTVLSQYQKAKIVEIKNKGFTLSNSPSPIEMKSVLITRTDFLKK
jgi:hypothetical protein